MARRHRQAGRQPAPPQAATRRRNGLHWAAACIVFGLVLAGVLPTARFPFVDWDDGPNVLQNPWLNPPTLHALAVFWKAPYYGVYAPVTRTVWLLLAWISGSSPDPRVFHAANAVVHALDALLVYALLLRLVKDVRASALGALFFAFHPLQAEAASWVTGMKDLLGGFFSLCALLAYVRYAELPAGTPKRWVWYGAGAAAYLLALLSKPAAASVPLMAWVLDTAFLRRSAGKATLALAPWLLPLAPAALVTASAEKANSLVPYTPWSARPIVAADALAFYLAKLVWPVGLCMDYGHTPRWILRQQWRLAAFAAPVALALAAWISRRRAAEVPAAIGLFVAALLPVLGIVPFAYQAYSTTADRYAYLALLGPAWLVAWFLARRRGAWSAAAAGILLLYGVLFSIQAQTWRSSRALFTHALQVNPSSSIANNNMGVMEMTDGRYSEALRRFERALRTAPEYPEAHYNLGLLYARLGRTDAAEAQFRDVIRWKPDYAMAFNDLGVLLLQQGRLEEARDCFVKALQIQPNVALFQNNLAIVLQRMAAKSHIPPRTPSERR